MTLIHPGAIDSENVVWCAVLKIRGELSVVSACTSLFRDREGDGGSIYLVPAHHHCPPPPDMDDVDVDGAVLKRPTPVDEAMVYLTVLEGSDDGSLNSLFTLERTLEVALCAYAVLPGARVDMYLAGPVAVRIQKIQTTDPVDGPILLPSDTSKIKVVVVPEEIDGGSAVSDVHLAVPLVHELSLPPVARPRCILVKGSRGTGKTFILSAVSKPIPHDVLISHCTPVLRALPVSSPVICIDNFDALVERVSFHPAILSNLLGTVPPSTTVVLSAVSKPDIPLPNPLVTMEIPALTLEGRTALLKVLLADYPDIPVAPLAAITSGHTPASLKSTIATASLVSSLTIESLVEAARSISPPSLRQYDILPPGEPWSGVSGRTSLKQYLHRTVIDPWSTSPTSGVIIHGPSSSGKSALARGLASTLGFSILPLTPTAVLSKYVGESEASVRRVFSDARAAAPCAILMDDVDSLAANRENDAIGVYSRILTTLLNELDGVDTVRGDVIVIATSSRLKDVDSALLRAGRLEVRVLVEQPTKDDITAMVKDALENIKVNVDVKVGDNPTAVEVVAAIKQGLRNLTPLV